MNRPAGPLPAGRYAARIGTTFDYAAFGLEEPTATFDVVAE